MIFWRLVARVQRAARSGSLDASKYKGGEKPGKRIVYGRGAAKAANDEYYFRVADGKFE